MLAGGLALACANQGAAVAWVAPTFRNTRPLWRFAERICRPLDGLVTINKADRTIEFPSGGWLGMYSADADVGLRGEAFDLVIVDEAARVPEETFTDVIVPTVADRAGRIMLISTPKGQNWFWREYVAAAADMEERAAWSAPTADNPIPSIRRAAQLARERLPDRTYRQEWLAEFVEDGGGVFRGVREATTATLQDHGEEGRRYVVGIDWGKVEDFTVITVLDVSAQPAAVVAIDRFNQIDYAFQLGRLEAICQRFGTRELYPESNSMGIPVIEQLERRGYQVTPFVTTSASKKAGVEALSLALEKGDLVIPPHPHLGPELLAFSAERLPSGSLRYGAPAGMHDDCVMSLVFAWSAIANGPSQGVWL